MKALFNRRSNTSIPSRPPPGSPPPSRGGRDSMPGTPSRRPLLPGSVPEGDSGQGTGIELFTTSSDAPTSLATLPKVHHNPSSGRHYQVTEESFSALRDEMKEKRATLAVSSLAQRDSELLAKEQELELDRKKLVEEKAELQQERRKVLEEVKQQLTILRRDLKKLGQARDAAAPVMEKFEGQMDRLAKSEQTHHASLAQVAEDSEQKIEDQTKTLMEKFEGQMDRLAKSEQTHHASLAQVAEDSEQKIEDQTKTLMEKMASMESQIKTYQAANDKLSNETTVQLKDECVKQFQKHDRDLGEKKEKLKEELATHVASQRQELEGKVVASRSALEKLSAKVMTELPEMETRGKELGERAEKAMLELDFACQTAEAHGETLGEMAVEMATLQEAMQATVDQLRVDSGQLMSESEKMARIHEQTLARRAWIDSMKKDLPPRILVMGINTEPCAISELKFLEITKEEMLETNFKDFYDPATRKIILEVPIKEIEELLTLYRQGTEIPSTHQKFATLMGVPHEERPNRGITWVKRMLAARLEAEKAEKDEKAELATSTPPPEEVKSKGK